MNNKIKIAILGAALLAVLYTLVPKATADTPLPRIDQLEGEHISSLMIFTMQQHLKKHRPTPEINVNTLSNFVSVLDPSRVFLLSSEVAALHGQRLNMLNAFNNNRWSFVTNFYQGVFLPNLKNSYEHAVRVLSSTNYVPDVSLKVPVEYKDLPYPATKEERIRNLEASLAYQVAFLESMGEPRSNACQKVIKRRESIRSRCCLRL